MKIKAVSIGKYRDQNPVYSFCKENNKKIKDDVQKLPSKILALNAKAGERNKLKTDYGSWFVLHLNGWSFGVCTPVDYPERHAYKMIEEIKVYIQKNINQNPNDFNKGLKKTVQEVSNKYEDLAKVDKLYRAQTEVNMLEQQLHTGIRKLMGNQQNLNELDDRAMEMKSFAKQFESKCAKVESISFWHKWKLILMIAATILGVLAFTVVVMMIKL